MSHRRQKEMKCSLCAFLCRVFSTLESKRQVLNVRTHEIFQVDNYACNTIATVEMIDNYHCSIRIHCFRTVGWVFFVFFSEIPFSLADRVAELGCKETRPIRNELLTQINKAPVSFVKCNWLDSSAGSLSRLGQLSRTSMKFKVLRFSHTLVCYKHEAVSRCCFSYSASSQDAVRAKPVTASEWPIAFGRVWTGSDSG